MPHGPWYTPYRFPVSKCLTIDPCQGAVFQLSDETVFKVPFQYPVDAAVDADEADDRICISLRSFALFKKESAFYDVLAKRPHPNLAQRLQCKQLSGIVLHRLNSLEQVWSLYPKEKHYVWIQQLVSALEWLEDLGYTHGDLKPLNMGVDRNGNLTLFDFGSIIHRDEGSFYAQVLDDHVSLATCIHFLASGIIPGILSILQRGQGNIDEAAKDFDEIILAGWAMGPRSASSFSEVRKAVEGIVGKTGCNGVDQLENASSSTQLAYDDMVERDSRWMEEEDYRTAWCAIGYMMPDYI